MWGCVISICVYGNEINLLINDEEGEFVDFGNQRWDSDTHRECVRERDFRRRRLEEEREEARGN